MCRISCIEGRHIERRAYSSLTWRRFAHLASSTSATRNSRMPGTLMISPPPGRFLIVEHGHLIQAAVDGDVVPVAGLAVQSVDVLGDEVFVGEPFVRPVGPVI